MRIRFISEQVYEQGGPNVGPRFPEGFVLDEADVQKVLGLKEPPTGEWAQGFLQRWLQRRVAEEVSADVPATASAEVGSGRRTKPADLHGMTRAQLEAEAKKRHIDVSKARTRADVLSAIEKAAKK